MRIDATTFSHNRRLHLVQTVKLGYSSPNFTILQLPFTLFPGGMLGGMEGGGGAGAGYGGATTPPAGAPKRPTSTDNLD